MDKLFDLMLMSAKYQLVCSSCLDDLMQVLPCDRVGQSNAHMPCIDLTALHPTVCYAKRETLSQSPFPACPLHSPPCPRGVLPPSKGHAAPPRGSQRDCAGACNGSGQQPGRS